MKPFVYTAVPNSGGSNHYIGVTADAEAFSWGKNNNLGQLGRASTTSNDKNTPRAVELETNEKHSSGKFVKAFVGGSAESGHSALLDSDGFLWLAGCDRWQQLGLGSAAGGSSGYTWNQGRVWRNSFVKNEFLATKMEGATIRDVALGGDHTVVLSSNQSDVYVFGKGGDGQLGVDGKPFVSAPTRSKMLTSWNGERIAAVCAIQHCSLTLDENGDVLNRAGKCRNIGEGLKRCVERAAMDGLLSKSMM